ncbi:MAG: TonB-dependent receptor plug domain-containing protein [Bacteroidetes bacterium]|nr:TonB-dependent receptor plug domain-containing protein [Bacteroidota bacterium]
MKTVFFLVFVLIYLPSNVLGQVVSGVVRSSSGTVPFVTVGIKGAQLGTVSDENGKFSLKTPRYGRYTILAKCVGFEDNEVKVTIDSIKQNSVVIVLKEFTNALNEVVVSGTLQEISKNESPISVDVITPKLFQKNPTSSLFDAMQMVNGVIPQINCNVCSTGDIHINGMEGPYTMVTIDGMPIVSGLATVYGLSGIPNSLVNRVEVVKGPASTLYGSEAVAGVINVITKSPNTAPNVSVESWMSSQLESNTDVGVKYKYKNIEGLLGVNYFNLSNRVDVNKDGFTDITLQNRISVFNKLSFVRKNNYAATVAIRYIYEDRFGGELNWNKSFRGTDSIYGESIYTNRIEVLGNYQLPITKWNSFLQYSFTAHKQNSFYGFVPYMANQNIAFLQSLNDRKVGSNGKILLGFPMRFTFYDDNTVATQRNLDSSKFSNNPQRIFMPGVFIQYEHKVKSTTILVGSRIDYNSVHGLIVSPRLALKQKLNDVNTLRVSVGNGFRVVNVFTEDHAALTGSRQVVIKENLSPEKSWNANLNYTSTFVLKSGYLNLDAGLFYTYFANKIVPDYFTDANKIIYANLDGYGISNGANFSIDWSMTNGFKCLLGATIMKSYLMQADSTNSLVRFNQLFTPLVSGNFTISYTFKSLGVTVDYTGIVKSPMRLPLLPNDFRPEESPWHTIQNIQFTKKLTSKFEIFAGLKNIFNFIPKHPIIRPFDPFDKYVSIDNPNNYTFDPTYNYAPIQGIRGFGGFRYNLYK